MKKEYTRPEIEITEINSSDNLLNTSTTFGNQNVPGDNPISGSNLFKDLFGK